MRGCLRDAVYLEGEARLFYRSARHIHSKLQGIMVLMRIAFTSDLHVDITAQNQMLLPHLVEEFRRLEPDVIVLAGDVANDLAGWEGALKHFGVINVPKLIIPGNHDVWLESKKALKKGKDSAWKYRIALPQCAERCGFHYLPEQPLVVGDIGFAGSLGWYDYTLRDKRLDTTLSKADYEQAEFPEGSWNDVRQAAWLRDPQAADWRRRRLRVSDIEVCEKMRNELDRDLQRIASQASKLVVVVHTAPIESALERRSVPDPFDAYEGSIEIGLLLKELASRRDLVVICGHRHRPLDVEEGDIRVVRSPIGYLDGTSTDYPRLARERIAMLVM